MENARNPDRTRVTKGKILEVERRQDSNTEGNTQLTEEWEVSHGSAPTSAAFGLIESVIINDENHRKSKQRETRLDVDDLFTLPSLEKVGLDELGGDEIESTSIPVDPSLGLDALTNSGHLVTSSRVVQTDRANAKLEESKVVSWNPRKIEVKKAAEATGADIEVTKQVVADATEWPTTDENTLGLKRTQVGADKFLQEFSEVSSEAGILTSDDAFGFEGHPTVTTRQRVDSSFSLPAKDALTVAQRLEHQDGFNKIYIKTNVKTGWPELVSYDHEPISGKRVEVLRTFSSTEPTVGVNATPRVVTTAKQTGVDRWAVVNRTIDPSILTTTFSEYHPVEYRFPPYLDEDSPFHLLVIEGRSVINSLRSSAQRLKIPCLFETTYSTTVPIISDVFQFKPIDINLQTGTNTIFENGVITDGTTISIRVSFATAPIAFEFPPSSPTTTEYKALMGTNVLIADDVSRWKYNLWQRTKVWMKLPNLSLGLDGSLTYS